MNSGVEVPPIEDYKDDGDYNEDNVLDFAKGNVDSSGKYKARHLNTIVEGDRKSRKSIAM